jgi:hypothetical protein
VRACAEIQGRFVWGISERGFESHLAAGMDQNMLDARCESCGPASLTVRLARSPSNLPSRFHRRKRRSRRPARTAALVVNLISTSWMTR